MISGNLKTPPNFKADAKRYIGVEAMRYIGAEAMNVDGSYSNAARIMQGLLNEIERLENLLEKNASKS